MKTLALLLAATLLGPAASAAETRVRLEKRGEGTYSVEGSFQVAAPAEAAWKVLTDYDNLPKFVPDMKTSEVVKRTAEGVMLKQAAVGRFLFIAKTVRLLLDVKEEEPRKITFTDVLGKDFESYSGSWSIQGNNPTVVTYRLLVRPKTSAPGPFARAAIEKGAVRLLEFVKREIERTAGLPRERHVSGR